MALLGVQAAALGMTQLEALRQAGRATRAAMAELFFFMAEVAAAALGRLAPSGKLPGLVMVALVFHHP